VHLVSEARGRHPSLNVALLDDLRGIYLAAGQPDALPTSALLAGLRDLEESPWRDLRGKPLDPAQLARRLRGFDVRSTNLRIGPAVVKGYRRADLTDAWDRYLPAIPGNPATPATSTLLSPH
jgi:hypothetical protein